MIKFDIVHDNSQGVVMRIFNAVSRRALEFCAFEQHPHVDPEGNVTLSLGLAVTDKQQQQLLRDWLDVVGVIAVEVHDAKGRLTDTLFAR